MNAPLRMVSVPVDLRALARAADARAWSGRHRPNGGLATASFDEGRALHHLLVETFGPSALQPFRLMVAPDARSAHIYAYGTDSQDALQTRANETALPEAKDVFDLTHLRTKDMPAAFTIGRRLAFDVRVRPVVRLHKALPNPRPGGQPYKAGAELDAYVVEACRRFPDDRPRIIEGEVHVSAMEREGRTRTAVYRDWLAARLGAAATLDTESVRLAHYARRRIARSGPGPDGPDATLHGELVVADPVAFQALLTNGIGRHKAYGYGMLLLRPADPRRKNATS